jgi:hypothetical protein
VLAHDLRERSAQQCERSQQEGLELYPGRHSRGGGVGLTPLAKAEFPVLLTAWGPAEARKALGGKHAIAKQHTISAQSSGTSESVST